ncbi:MAG: GAF domain-containing protein [Fimbriimonas sp.]|nr:GAF domain-containing protein [Fimbriimonas sp.]
MNSPNQPDNSLLSFLDVATHADSREELLSDLVATCVSNIRCDSCDILYREAGDGLVLRASTAFPELNNRLKLGKGIGLSGQVLLTGEPVFISKDATKQPNYTQYPGFDENYFESLVILPLLGNSHQAFGILLLRRTAVWRLSPAERRRLTEISRVISGCLRAYNAAYQAGAQINRLGALSEVSKTIATSPYVEEILQLLVNLTAQQFNYRVCTVRLLDEHRGELVLRATQAQAKAYQRKRAIKLGESIAGRAIAENRPIIVRDVRIEEDYIGHDLAVEQGLRSMVCVPLMMQNKPVGVISCYTSEVRDFLPDEIKALETLAKTAAVSIEHAKLQVRTTLMQEMHHRVKNNLQQIASLLRLQMRHSNYKSLEEALNDCMGRILAIASVHDLLSREDLDHVGIRSIADTLVHHQKSTLMLPNRQIQYQVRGQDVILNMTQATQIALVLNELIQNAMEHGFKQTQSGEIHINVEEHDDEVSVWVSNSGDCLPEDFDAAAASNLGLKIVDNLARSLGGKFKMSNVLGWTVAEVKFPKVTGE